jgi:UrcA family protein
MKYGGISMRKIIAAGVAATLALAMGVVSAANQEPEQIKVEASRVVKKDAGSNNGIPITSYSVSYEVSLDDLDLATTAGMAAADTRINNAAAQACKAVAQQLVGLDAKDDPDCVRSAAKPALSKVHKAAGAKAHAS